MIPFAPRPGGYSQVSKVWSAPPALVFTPWQPPPIGSPSSGISGSTSPNMLGSPSGQVAGTSLPAPIGTPTS